MDVEVWPDQDTASAAAAEHLARWLHDAVEARSVASLGLSGGATPLRMFEELAKTEMPWQAIHLFQVDERLAPDKHQARNLTSLREHFLAHISLPGANFHPMPVGLTRLADGVERYEGALQEIAGNPPVLDAVHLGLGDDGHVASLFLDDSALEVEDADIAITAEHNGWTRMTLTVPALERARHLLWLVTGESKAHALASLLADDDIPATRIHHPGAIVVADRSAAAHVMPE